MLLDLENIEEKFEQVVFTDEWKEFVDKFKKAKVVFIVGNGGQYPTAAHASSDASRLVENKVIISMDNMSYLTSVANDYGYESVFEDWLKKQFEPYNQLGAERDDIFVVGLSCSGNSQNVINAIKAAFADGYQAALISGKESRHAHFFNTRGKNATQINMDVRYFHTAEILSMYLLYEAIAECGGRCPTILEEIERKSI